MPKSRTREIFKRVTDFMHRRRAYRAALKHKEEKFVGAPYPLEFKSVAHPIELKPSSNRRKRYYRAMNEGSRLSSYT